MRKINPSDICDDFRTEISDLESFLTDSIEVAASSRKKSILAELVFHRGYVAVEAFLSAWFVGAINRDSSQFLTHRSNAVQQSLSAKFSTWDVSHLTYSPPAHISVADLKKLLDPDGWNITFNSFDNLKNKCADLLVPLYRAKVNGVSSQRGKIIDAAKSIRNCIAHQSRSSFTEMNSLVGSLPNAGVAGNLRTSVNSITNVGSHLKSSVGGKMRVEHYLSEFKNLGSDLK
jgi:hypothetical protein